MYINATVYINTTAIGTEYKKQHSVPRQLTERKVQS